MALDTVTNIVPPILQSKRNQAEPTVEAPVEKVTDTVTDEMYMPEMATGPKAPSFEEVKQQYFSEINPALERLKAAETEKDIFAAEQKQSELEGLIEKQKRISEAYGKEKEAIKGSVEFGQLRDVNEQLMNAEFIPTEDTAKDIAGLFSLVGVIGFAIGAGGKGNAINAMSAMNGMLKGYREGRADLYKRERETFDKNLQALKVKSDSLSQRLKQIAELAAIDTRAANAEADQLFAQTQANFYREYKDKFGIAATVEFAKRNVDAVNKVYDFYNKIVAASQKGAGGGVGAIQNRYNIAMVGAGNLLALEIQNLAQSPLTAAPPFAQNVLTDPAEGITSATTAYFAQKNTSAENRAVQQTIASMIRAMARIEGQGIPRGQTEAAINELNKLAPTAGDSKINTFLFMAIAKQHMDLLVKDLAAAGGNELQMKQAMDARNKVVGIIPYNVTDVYRVIRAGGPELQDQKVLDLLKYSTNLTQFESGVEEIKQQPASYNEMFSLIKQNNPKKSDQDIDKYIRKTYPELK